MDPLNGLVDLLMDFLVMGGVPGYLVLQLRAAIVWRGGWRVAAVVPLLPAMAIAAWCGYAFAEDSNLWPLPFIFFAPIGAIYLMIVTAMRVIVDRPA